MEYHPGKFVWFEHLSHDIPKARAFYGTLFGWRSDPVEMGGEAPYPMIQNGEQGIGGFREGPPNVRVHWVPYLSVPDVDASFKAATAAGARALMQPTDFGAAGRAAALADPTGASFAIWKGAQGDRPDVAEIAMGDWYWNELVTTDEKKALAFYEGTFGFTGEGMDMGPMGTYYLLKKDGTPRAGLMKAPAPEDGSNWLPYVRVADCDASTAKAQSLGARIAMPPRDIPNIGRFSVLIDPLGAAIAVMRGQPAAQ
ncbi:MAG TPA: VOC family protein [Reyranella sp.]|nr:VOC family protein [Reyranella sp.]